MPEKCIELSVLLLDEVATFESGKIGSAGAKCDPVLNVYGAGYRLAEREQ